MIFARHNIPTVSFQEVSQKVMKASVYNACVLQTDIRSLELIALTAVQEGVHETKKRNFVSLRTRSGLGKRSSIKNYTWNRSRITHSPQECGAFVLTVTMVT